ncbi:N-methyl-L-tryptophan oxidase [Solicola gregarius]|uniref:N-methyl-L-tryptophan oxidase n=1 Tax=Solicola gregarius TaxID=2908642 RepID=A0AA46TJJ1_9ACTN|nr:N-methyl-L-tryptophan oxidase [Solicola gregarius]UYM06445.1 N-methyl-L-tryptophan oxidase [Solicola gregarius]
MDAQVAVIGTGSIGSMTLWQLARAGVSAIGFEQFGIAHDRAAAGGESRIFRTAYLEGPEYVPLLRRAHELWRELEAESGRALLTLNGGLMIGDRDSEAMRNVQASIDDFGLRHEVLDHTAMASRYPQHAIDPDEIAILDLDAGVLRPEFAVAAATYRARELAAAIRPHEQVTAIEPAADSVLIRTDRGAYAVEQAVVTTGPWTARFAPALASHIRPRRLVMTWYQAEDPELWRSEACPIFIRDNEDAHIFGIPTLDGGSVKVAPHSDDDGYLADADELDRNVEVDLVEPVNAAVARYLPGLIPEPVRVSAYMDAYTSDGHGVVGRAPGAENVWLLGAFSGHGFKMATAFGQVASDLVRHGTTDLPIGHLDPARFGG